MTTKQLVILTGASRGLGAALAERLLAPGVLLLTLSRRPSPALQDQAKAAGATLEQWAIDVGHDVGTAARLETWLHRHASDGFAAATLINNAGLLGPVGPIDRSNAEQLAAVLRVGLEAPIVLTAAFLCATRNWAIDKRVLNISSGAGRRPITGWASYCAAKAGLDHYSRVVALDEVLRPHPARIVSLAPGVIDTDMQGELRVAEAAGFPEQSNFIQLKASGQLPAPDAAAARVLAYLARPDFGSQPVADVRDA
jgi:NAD(P)-dependent dehydrogenase (short-subunit alcohol dehydrogenase family)